MRNSGVGNAKLHPLYAVIQEPHDESNTHALRTILLSFRKRINSEAEIIN